MSRLQQEEVTVSEITEDDKQFADEIAINLGYTDIQQKIKTTNVRKEILVELKKKDIDVFTEKSVDKYKKYMKIKANYRSYIYPVLSFVFGLIAIGSILEGIIMQNIPDYIGAPIFILSCFLSFLSILFYSHSNKYVWKYKYFSEQTRPIGRGIRISGNYTKIIPEYVLTTALEIKKIYPDCGFLVEELSKTERVFDPFLIACIDGQRFYCDVWLESKYEQDYEN